jgi:glycosyltransferase involved in cell wall biosynthesis
MKIAQFAPLFESVPPKLYGGTERVVSYLTDELVKQGHEVTLFASGDSVTDARLVPCSERALRLEGCIDPLAHQIVQLERLAKEMHRFDVVHFHVDYLHYPFSRHHALPHLTTLHGRLDLPDLVPLYAEFSEMPVVSISDAQRAPLPWVNWLGTVHHGLPPDLYALRAEPGQYLAFLGRISPEKRVDRAIEIARRVGMPIRIAAKVDRVDEAYFKERILPLLDDPLVEFIGEIGDADKGAFLGGAHALLFPIDWPEPFGLVTIEAMACGTPTVAYRMGSIPEIIDPGVTGYVVDDINSAIRAVERIALLDRRRCRQVFEARFSVVRMARAYLAMYERIASRRQSVRPGAAARSGVGAITLAADRRSNGGAESDRATALVRSSE